MEILGISEEEAQGLWSLLAAIYHLGFAASRKVVINLLLQRELIIFFLSLPPGSGRGMDYFLNPAAAQRAATVLGVDHETLGQDIFNPPRGGAVRVANPFNPSFASSSPTQSDTTSITSSLFLTNMGGSRTAYLDGFCDGPV